MDQLPTFKSLCELYHEVTVDHERTYLIIRDSVLNAAFPQASGEHTLF